ncbi:hypothetical protein ACJ2A9_03515 [Anaerobacillus sp. MEB173]|uniref:hypothetical protein n=1 Tax=Anaerobacillus sp. MEB173 TaxID=3383345 RepID=UPI003F911549
MKKKIVLTAASAVITIGVLAACGGQEIDEPMLNDEPEIEMQQEAEPYEEGYEMEEGFEEAPVPEETGEELDLEFDSSNPEEDSLEMELEENEAIDGEIEG